VLTSLKHWSLVHFGTVRKELEQLWAKLAGLQAANVDTNDIPNSLFEKKIIRIPNPFEM
jgi:hypothetical protein